MRCQNCGYENNDGANFCKKCGSKLIISNKPLATIPKKNNSKVLIVCVSVIIVVLLIALAVIFSGVLINDSSDNTNKPIEEVTAQSEKSWQLIGSYNGSGSGSQSLIIPPGEIKIKISAFPIKNYATNYLSFSGENGYYSTLDWTSTSPVATKYDSLSYTSSKSVEFKINYYEIANWQIDIYRYQ